MLKLREGLSPALVQGVGGGGDAAAGARHPPGVQGPDPPRPFPSPGVYTALYCTILYCTAPLQVYTLIDKADFQFVIRDCL